MRHFHSPDYRTAGTCLTRFELRSGPLTTTLYLSSDGRIVAKSEIVAGRESFWEYDYDAYGRLIRAALDGLPVEEYRYGARGERVAGTGGRCPMAAMDASSAQAAMVFSSTPAAAWARCAAPGGPCISSTTRPGAWPRRT